MVDMGEADATVDMEGAAAAATVPDRTAVCRRPRIVSSQPPGAGTGISVPSTAAALGNPLLVL